MTTSTSKATSTFEIRTATEADFKAITTIDVAANATHPVIQTTIPSPIAQKVIFHDKFKSWLSQPEKYQFLVAVSSASSTSLDHENKNKSEILGFIVGCCPQIQVEGGKRFDVENLPEEVDKAALAKFLARNATRFVERENLGWSVWEIKSLAVLPVAQGRGIGGALVRRWLEGVDAVRGRAFVVSSPVGRGLYAKMGFGVVGSCVFELGGEGQEVRYENWDMVREVRS